VGKKRGGKNAVKKRPPQKRGGPPKKKGGVPHITPSPHSRKQGAQGKKIPREGREKKLKRVAPLKMRTQGNPPPLKGKMVKGAPQGPLKEGPPELEALVKATIPKKASNSTG